MDVSETMKKLRELLGKLKGDTPGRPGDPYSKLC
jgi:hypothetical protein